MTRDETLIKAASTLINLEKELTEAKEKIASLEKRAQCEVLAKRMIEKGLISDNIKSFSEKVASFMKEDDLSTWEKAIEISLGGLDLGENDDREKIAGANKVNPILALIYGEDE